MLNETIERIETAIATLVSLITHGHTLLCALSGGKGSTCTAILVLEASRLPIYFPWPHELARSS
ncbi:hypothetical protein [Burkholderia vietnamiensis]|uniref:hypothetical protein n=1 Tax=Burkholderia vietnamiensis TaxID=60552 RepID=UPI000ABF6587|nr:hypothetical protein [Burkholderia vietnamiensis]